MNRLHKEECGTEGLYPITICTIDWRPLAPRP
jgi:hypothetical protein